MIAERISIPEPCRNKLADKNETKFKQKNRVLIKRLKRKLKK